MKKILATAASAVLLLSACGQSNRTDGAEEPQESGQSATTPETSERGNILKDIGEQAIYGVGECEGEDCVTFAVTSIEPSAPCEYSTEEPSGKSVAVHLTIDTSPSVPKEELQGVFQTFNWAVVDAQGTTRNNTNGELMAPCDTDPNGLGGALSPGSHYEGVMNFDIPEGSKILVLNSFGMASWEWQIPA